MVRKSRQRIFAIFRICTLSEYKEARYHTEKEKCGQGMLSKDNQDMQLGAALVVQDPGSQGG